MEGWILMGFQILEGKIQKAIKTVIYGPEGIGKTTIAAQFPDPLFIDTEGSTNQIDVKRLKAPTSFAELLQMIDWVVQTKPCSTLVIDTIDWAERLATEEVLGENNWQSMESVGFGKSYQHLYEKMGRLLDRLSNVVEVDINVVLVGHSKVEKFDDPGEMGSYDRWQLKLRSTGKTDNSTLVKEWADMVLFVNYKVIAVKTDENGKSYRGQGGKRTMYANHQPSFDAKNRFGLPDEMPMDYGQIGHVVPNLIQQPINQSVPQVPVQPTSQPVNEPVQQQQPTPQKEQPMPDPFAEQVIQQTPDEKAAIDAKVDHALGLGHNPALPKSLTDLMDVNDVSDDEIRGVMGVRGHFPIDTPFENIAASTPEYFQGGLASNWDGVMQVVTQIRANPQMLTDLFAKVNEPNPDHIVANMDIRVGG